MEVMPEELAEEEMDEQPKTLLPLHSSVGSKESEWYAYLDTSLMK